MAELFKLPGGIATVYTIDAEIEKLERLVEDDKVQHMIQVIIEKPIVGTEKAGLHKVHVSPMGAPLPLARDALKVAIEAINEMIGP